MYFGSSLKDPLVAGRGRKSPQNSMWLPAIPVPYGWIRVPRSGRRQTLIYIWSLPLARWGPVSHSPPEFCLSLLSENLWRCRRQQRSEKRSEGKKERPERWFASSLPSTLFFLFFPTPDLTPSLSSPPPSDRPTERGTAVSI